MSYSKQIKVGSLGTLTVTEAAGAVTLSVSLSDALGGGEAAGVAQASVSAQVQLSAKQLIDLGLDFAAAQFPSVAAVVKDVQAAVDAEIAAL